MLTELQVHSEERHPQRSVGVAMGILTLIVAFGAYENALWYAMASQLLLMSNAVRLFFLTESEWERRLQRRFGWPHAVVIFTAGMTLIVGLVLGGRIAANAPSLGHMLPWLSVATSSLCLVGTLAYYTLLPRIRRAA